ncbi:MAG TPA: hypothetical protein VMW87_04085 [Spirochaetia bacterium]|nr:hypothetical protein [Spirochaetia bacterium]
MKKSVMVLSMFAFVALAAFANGNAEQLRTLEGSAMFTPGPQSQLMLQTESGEQFAVAMPQGDLAGLGIRNQDRIRVRGMVVDSSVGDGTRTQARILAREVVANGKEIKVGEPVQLKDQDRLRLYSGDQTQDQTRDQTRTQSRDGTGSGKSKSGD